MRLRNMFVLGLLSATPALVQAAPVTYDSITFPEGNTSFADEYLDVIVGSPAPTAGNFDPAASLGPPNDGESAYSLGQGGYITYQFTDNSLTGSDDSTPDLHIFEVGPLVEDTFVWISEDNENFIDVGKVSGSTSSLDIDSFLTEEGIDPFTQFPYVRLQDDPNENTTNTTYAGADIDAVGAISSSEPVPVSTVPVPGALSLLFGGLLVLVARRRSAAV